VSTDTKTKQSKEKRNKMTNLVGGLLPVPSGVIGEVFEEDGRNCFDGRDDGPIYQVPKCVPLREASDVVVCMRAAVAGADLEGPYKEVLKRAQMRYGSAFQVESACVSLREAELVYAGVAKRIDGLVGSASSFSDAVQEMLRGEHDLVAQSDCAGFDADDSDVESVDISDSSDEEADKPFCAVAGEIGPSVNVGKAVEDPVSALVQVAANEFSPGHCYLAAVRVSWRQKALDVLGAYPTFAALMSAPADWYDSTDRLERLKCGYIGKSVWHVRDRGSARFSDLLAQVSAVPGSFPKGSLGALYEAYPGSGEYHGRLPCLADRLGADRVVGEVAFSTDPYCSGVVRGLNDPVGTVFHAVMRSRAFAPGLPDDVVCGDDCPDFPSNVGAVGRGHDYPTVPGAVVRYASVIPKIDDASHCVQNFGVVVDRPPGANYWAVVVPGVGSFVSQLGIMGREGSFQGPVVWFTSSSSKIGFDLSLDGATAFVVSIIEFPDRDSLVRLIHSTPRIHSLGMDCEVGGI